MGRVWDSDSIATDPLTTYSVDLSDCRVQQTNAEYIKEAMRINRASSVSRI